MPPLPSTPPPSSVPAPAHVRVVAAVPSGWQAYTVRPGDTLVDIARRLGTTPGVIAAQNQLPNGGRLIRAGAVLLVPAAAAPSGGPAPVAAAAAVPARSAAPNTFAGRTYPQAVVDAATANRNHLRAARVPNRHAMRAIISAAATRNGVDPRLALAIAYQESGWDQRQVSVANAVGAMQVIPSSGEWASSLAGRPLDLLAAEDNAVAGVVILRALGRVATSVDEVVAGYYQGLASVRAHGMYPDTKQYLATVKALLERV